MAEKIRVDKLLGNMGLGSRKEIKNSVKQGKVLINGHKATDSGQLVDPKEDSVVFSGKPVVYEPYVYLMLHKPAGYVSATQDNKEKTVMELLQAPYDKMDLFIAGRLDKDVEGFVLLTNDGDFAHRILSPKKHVPKTYFAEIQGTAQEEDIQKAKEGIVIDGDYTCQEAKLQILTKGEVSQVLLTIYEGRFHQVKKMFAALGKSVLYLKRIAIGGLLLDEKLALGSFRQLSKTEVEILEKGNPDFALENWNP